MPADDRPPSLPNLLLVGFPKCGTTSVAATLIDHPDVCGGSPFRAVSHFSPLIYDANAVLPSPEEYARRFPDWDGHRVVLDDTPVYVYGGKRVIRAVRDVLGAPRVLIMLREPLSRMISYVGWKKRFAELPKDIDLDRYLAECERIGPQAMNRAELAPYSGLYGSDYPTYLEPWITEFGDDLRIGFLDDLISQPRELYGEIASWLGIAGTHFDTAQLSAQNAAVGLRSTTMGAVFHSVGKTLRPLATRSPRVFHALSRAARTLNHGPAPQTPATTDVRERLNERFAQWLPELRDQVAGRTLLGVPAWVGGQRP